MSFETDYAGMLPDTLTYISTTRGDTGEMTETGSSSTCVCYIEEKTEVVEDREGKEVVSTVQVFVGDIGLTVNAHLYTLPSRFSVRLRREVLSVDHLSDENGAYAEVLKF